MPGQMNRLRIDLVTRTIEAEGDLDFVKKVYEDYKDVLKSPVVQASSPATPTVSDGSPAADEPKTNNPSKTRRARSRSDSAATERVSAYSPALDKDLDTKGLKAFLCELSAQKPLREGGSIHLLPG